MRSYVSQHKIDVFSELMSSNKFLRTSLDRITKNENILYTSKS